jgi:hypothetical protein
MRPLSVAAILILASFAGRAAAEPPKAAAVKQVAGEKPVAPAESPADDEGFLDRFVVDAGRIAPKPPEPGVLRFAAHGEYQLRYRAMTDLPLQPPVGQPSQNSLGQRQYLYHWLRVGLRLDVFDKISIVGQIDVPRGLVIGDTTEHVEVARDALNETKFYEVHPRALYLEWRSPIGVFRVGQQTSHWGMGLVANDGDHVTLFGDHRRGALVERVLYQTTLGQGSPIFVAVAGDLVFQDATARLLDGDRAYQIAVAAGYRRKHAEVGVYGVGRRMTRESQALNTLTPYTDGLTAGVFDVYSRFDAPIPGSSAFAYGGIEAAAIFGSTTFLRNTYGSVIDPTADKPKERIQSFGGAAVLGAVRVAGEGDDRWGQVVGEVELGYASGDANPYDGVTKRFTFDENHRVGLVLFDQVMRWKTARSATIAQDPALVARAAPGLELLPSNGGVFGAQYLNLRGVYRPRRWVDLKGGVVIAQTTADLVDPYQAGALGSYRNYDGGDPKKHDLGVELDLGAAFRISLAPAATIQMGFEGGVLFPGRAFDDALGNKMPNQFLLSTQLGIQY